jgi:hypothetical protein
MEQVRKKIETNRHIQVSRFVEQCFRGEIAKQEFIEGLSAARTKKESEEALKSAASPEVIKFFSNIVNGKKITDRKQQLDEIIQRLTLPTTNMLKELITFLDEGAGSNGPHSFKYHLLKKLFPDLNTDIKVTEIESVATIELFIKLGKNRLTQTLDAVPLSAVSKDDVEHSEESSESGRNLLKH